MSCFWIFSPVLKIFKNKKKILEKKKKILRKKEKKILTIIQATEHLGLILGSFPFSSAILAITFDANPKLQKSFNSTQVGISTRGTPCSLAKAVTVFLYSSLSILSGSYSSNFSFDVLVYFLPFFFDALETNVSSECLTN